MNISKGKNRQTVLCMVFCKLINERTVKDRSSVQLVEVRRVSSTLLYCEQKFYQIDPELKRLDERQICQVNPQEDGLYTMYYDVVLLAKGPDLDLKDGPVGETWHDRWRPTLRELVALLLEDMYPCLMLKHREVFDGLLRAHLHVAKLLLKKEEGASASSPLQLQLPPPKEQEEEATGVMEQQKKETPQMARMAKVLEAAVVNALELIDVAVEEAGGTTPMLLEFTLQ